MTFDLEDKKILLTGASGGIGSVIAHFLDKLGANLDFKIFLQYKIRFVFRDNGKILISFALLIFYDNSR